MRNQCLMVALVVCALIGVKSVRITSLRDAIKHRARRQQPVQAPAVQPVDVPAVPVAKDQGGYDVDKTQAPMQLADWDTFKKSDPGAVNFFSEFDQDGNKHWSQGEWDNAIREAIKRHYLPSNFDRVGKWAMLNKLAGRGEITLREFITAAAGIAAHSPPALQPRPPSSSPVTPRTSPRECGEAFQLFDKNHDGWMSHEEFKKAVQGKIADDHIEEKWLQLKRTTGNSISVTTWQSVCTALTGLPAGPKAEGTLDPCSPNPCKERGTMCKRNVHVCVTAPCPQYVCVKAEIKNTAQWRAYKDCKAKFASLDLNKDGQLDEREYKSGVVAENQHRGFGRLIDPDLSWQHMDKTKDSKVDVFEFVHFCIAIKGQGGPNQGTATEECWDVFHHWDSDHSLGLSKAEYDEGMRRAKVNGHMPATMPVKQVYKIFPKMQNNEVPPGPFVTWCLLVSEGKDPVSAAKGTIAPVPVPAGIPNGGPWLPPGGLKHGQHGQQYGGQYAYHGGGGGYGYKGGYKGGATVAELSPAEKKRAQELYRQAQAARDAMNPVPPLAPPASGKVTQPLGAAQLASTQAYCRTVFQKANVDSAVNKVLLLDEFHKVCHEIASPLVCSEYTSLFTAWDHSNTGQLHEADFVAGCQSMQVAVTNAQKVAAVLPKPSAPVPVPVPSPSQAQAPVPVQQAAARFRELRTNSIVTPEDELAEARMEEEIADMEPSVSVAGMDDEPRSSVAVPSLLERSMEFDLDQELPDTDMHNEFDDENDDAFMQLAMDLEIDDTFY